MYGRAVTRTTLRVPATAGTHGLLRAAVPAVVPSRALLHQTARREIATPILVGAGIVGAGLLAQVLLKPKGAGPAGGKWIKGGFNAKMDKKEAAQILGLRYVIHPPPPLNTVQYKLIHNHRETALTKAKVKEAHRRMMIANHPDRGGAPYLASSTYPTLSLILLLIRPADPLLSQRSTRQKTSSISRCPDRIHPSISLLLYISLIAATPSTHLTLNRVMLPHTSIR